MSNHLRATTLLAAVLLAACETPLDLDTPAGLSPAAMSASLAETPVMVGVSGGPVFLSASTLYAIDPGTGDVSEVGPVTWEDEFGTSHELAVSGLEFDPRTGKLYGATWTPSFPDLFNGLVEIDVGSGDATRIGIGFDAFGGTRDIGSITIDDQGRMFAWQEADFGAPDNIVEIDTESGFADAPVSAGHDLSYPGLDFDYSRSILRAVNAGGLYTVDRDTRSASTAGSLPASVTRGDFDPVTGLYYGLSSDGRQLVEVNLSEGSQHVVSNLPVAFHTVTFLAGPAAPENEPPVADAGADQEVECTCGDDGTTTVSLDGSASSDPDGTIVRWTWTDASETVVATDPTATVELGCGSVVLTLTVEDDAGATSTDEVVIDIVDRTDPEIQLDLEETTLWSPNHEMVTVSSTISATDACDPEVLVRVEVTSNQDENGTGDGNTDTDWKVLDNGDGTWSVALRAERAATDGDRVYTITVTATDAAGNTATDSGEVTVPLSQ